MGRRGLAVVVAHPDDDTFGCAGTVALHAEDPDFRFVLVHATNGEAGEIADGSGATRETLGAIREEEDRRSWVALGRVPDRHEWLRYRDHGLADVSSDELTLRVEEILREEQPDVVITFGPDGITGHPDHIAIGESTTTAFHRCREDGLPGFRRLIYSAIAQSTFDEWNRRLVDAGEQPMDPTRLYVPRGVPDEAIGVDVDTSDVAPSVLAAVREHRTQQGAFQDWSEEEQLRAMSRERGLVAWPRRQPGDPVIRGVFDGLDDPDPSVR
jgi:LmbE family N-acetylglucosaminyl deacetylase